MVRFGIWFVQMKAVPIKSCAFGLILASLYSCFGLSIVIPATNEVVCLNVTTGVPKWRTELPFRADSRIDLCGDLLRVVSAVAGDTGADAAFFSLDTGNFLPRTNLDCRTPKGTRYTVTGKTSEFFDEHWRLKPQDMING